MTSVGQDCRLAAFRCASLGHPVLEVMTMPARKDLPSTVARSAEKAQDTWGKTHDSAVEQYGEGERAHRTAFAALKHSHEKVGDHWEPKAQNGPSDAQAARSGRAARQGGRTAGGVDANASKKHLLQRRQAARHPGPEPDDQGRARRRDRDGQTTAPPPGRAVERTDRAGRAPPLQWLAGHVAPLSRHIAPLGCFPSSTAPAAAP